MFDFGTFDQATFDHSPDLDQPLFTLMGQICISILLCFAGVL